MFTRVGEDRPMEKRIKAIAWLGAFLVAVLWMVPWAVAQDSTALLKQANTDLRGKRAMFSGKLDEAQTLLAKVDSAVRQIKSTDANNPQLKSLEQKVTKLRSDLEKRAGNSQTPAAPTPPGQTATNTDAAEKLPAAIMPAEDD